MVSGIIRQQMAEPTTRNRSRARAEGTAWQCDPACRKADIANQSGPQSDGGVCYDAARKYCALVGVCGKIMVKTQPLHLPTWASGTSIKTGWSTQCWAVWCQMISISTCGAEALGVY